MLPDEVAHLAVTTQLPDGAVLSLRPIRPDDGQMLAEGFRRLSPESRFLRFFSPLDHLSAAQLRYFTDIDYVDHFAWVATIASAPARRILATNFSSVQRATMRMSLRSLVSA